MVQRPTVYCASLDPECSFVATTFQGVASLNQSAAEFCTRCGGLVVERFLDSEQRSRGVCLECGFVAYRNPLVLVAAIVAVGTKVLLCRRVAAPAAGRWAPPGGFLECGEALEEAAARETLEETGVQLDPALLRLHALSTLTSISEVYVGFLAELFTTPRLACGPECAEARFFGEEEVPWTELAYEEIGEYLRVYFRERRTGDRAIHVSRLDAFVFAGTTYKVSDNEATHWRRDRKTARSSRE